MENQRVRLTKTLLAQSLLELMKTKPVESVSVAELCRHAGINRTTFYKYYHTPEEVLQEVSRANQAYLAPVRASAASPLEVLTAALTHTREDVSRAKALNDETTRQLHSQPHRVPEGDVYYAVLAQGVPERYRPYARYMTSAAMTYWLKDPEAMPEAEFARLLLQVSEVCRQMENQK